LLILIRRAAFFRRALLQRSFYYARPRADAGAGDVTIFNIDFSVDNGA
jgi:hypothetical protein